jgi:hypothetical protein
MKPSATIIRGQNSSAISQKNVGNPGVWVWRCHEDENC